MASPAPSFHVPPRLVEALRDLQPEERLAVLSELDEEARHWCSLAFRHDWELHCRPEQALPDGHWDTFVMLAGRGGGKTRPMAELVTRWAKDNPLIALMAKDAAMIRDVMLEGESGILACSPPWWRPKYDRTKLRLTWPNGAVALALAAEAGADAARGRQFYKAWAEEVVAWPHVEDAWHQGLMNALRLGKHPQVGVTSTPKPTPFIEDLCLGPMGKDGRRTVGREETTLGPEGWARWEYSYSLADGRVNRVVVSRWRSDRNADNLAPGFVEARRLQYGIGSRMAAQELDAEILSRTDGAIWQAEWLERRGMRVSGLPVPLKRVLVSVDPSHSEDGGGDAAGIIAGGLGEDGHAYLLDDRTLQGSPMTWATTAIDLYNRLSADAIVIEVTAVQSGKRGHIVKDTIRAADPEQKIKWIEIHHGTDKRTRAEPVAAMYEQDPPRVHHVTDAERRDLWVELENEYVTWVPGEPSPNRMDAAVQLVAALLLGEQRKEIRLL